MPWLVGIIADASDLRWGLAVAAFTPLFMFVFSFYLLFSSVDVSFIRLPCIHYMKKNKQPSNTPEADFDERAE